MTTESSEKALTDLFNLHNYALYPHLGREYEFYF